MRGMAAAKMVRKLAIGDADVLVMGVIAHLELQLQAIQCSIVPGDVPDFIRTARRRGINRATQRA